MCIPLRGYWFSSFVNVVLLCSAGKTQLVKPNSIEFFTANTKLAEMSVILASKDLTTTKKLPPVGLDLMQEIITGLRVQCLTN